MTSKEVSSEPISRFWVKINLLAEIASIFRDVPDKRATFDRTLRIIQKVVFFDSAALYLLNFENKKLEMVTFLGERFVPGRYTNVEIKPDFNGWMERQRLPALLTRRCNKKTSESNVEYILVVPLVVADHFIGAVIFVNQREDSFRDKDVKLLSIIGNQMALSIERLNYQRRLEEGNQALLRAQEELRSAQEKVLNDEKLAAVRQLAASINHEINNPLSVITGNVEYLIYVGKGLDEKVIARLKIIETEALRIAEINRRLLDIQTLTSEAYVKDDESAQMLNLHKSIQGAQDV